MPTRRNAPPPTSTHIHSSAHANSQKSLTEPKQQGRRLVVQVDTTGVGAHAHTHARQQLPPTLLGSGTTDCAAGRTHPGSMTDPRFPDRVTIPPGRRQRRVACLPPSNCPPNSKLRWKRFSPIFRGDDGGRSGPQLNCWWRWWCGQRALRPSNARRAICRGRRALWLGRTRDAGSCASTGSGRGRSEAAAGVGGLTAGLVG